MKTLETLFERAGFTATSDAELIKQKLLIINNPDGSIRWAWPYQCKEPLFLKFYNSNGLRAQLFTLGFKLIFILGLQKLVFKVSSVVIPVSKLAPFNVKKPWALFTGTIGPNRKAIFYGMNNNHYRFLKVAIGTAASSLLENEKLVLTRLTLSKIDSFDFPNRSKTVDGTLQLSDVNSTNARNPKFSALHQNVLSELYSKTGTSRPLGSLPVWIETQNTLKKLLNSHDTRLPNGMLHKLACLVESFDENMVIETSLCHGDFTSWNMYAGKDKMYVYDWELSQPLMPIGFDAFHFIIQQGTLVDRVNWKTLSTRLEKNINDDVLATISANKTQNSKLYFKLYLAINTVHYLQVYHRQPEWHIQINWLLNTWNQALSEVLEPTKNARELVIIDAFDFLKSKQYAAFRFPDMYPGKLSTESDIDLCITKQDALALIQFLSKHPLVKLATAKRLSFMRNLELVFNDGGILSIDLLHTIKRKNLVLLNSEQIIKNGLLNPFGVKVVHPKDAARYTGLFYALNHYPIPSKYSQYSELLSKSNQVLDILLTDYYQNESTEKPTINFIKLLAANRGINYVINTLNYAIDCVRNLFTKKGMIITFSGVDGAGKSTVIENIKHGLDKTLRRKVVVLRHRPSVLPILSAWQKGKQQAEQDAASKLPRQGKNNSTLSSLLRFGYYYTDYLFGQFYIQARYVWRGYTVLYDRYYFDFIADSKRSNIELPNWFTKGAYALLLKPDVNFFLYASPETILNRKQELDEETVSKLTHSYLTLFNKLGNNKSNTQYQSIENVDLNETLATIMNKLTHLIIAA